MPISFRIINVKAQEQKDLNGITVATYQYSGLGSDLIYAVTNMFSWMNATVDIISLSQILEGGLSEYDIFVIPGGSVASYDNNFGEQGKEIIRNYVKNGGSYFGICGGSHFGTEAYLNLYPGRYIAPVPGIETTAEMIIMNVNKKTLWLDLSHVSSRLTTLYLNGGYFDEVNKLYSIDMFTVAEYSENNMPGMIACKYGSGAVFLSSPHLEIEEDHNRDGYSLYDTYEDPESEWDLALEVSLWLINPSQPVIYLVFDIIGLSICALVVVFVLYQTYIKKGSKKAEHIESV